MFKDYYSILDLHHHSSPSEIKTSYKRKASKWHPDRCNLPNSVEMMQEINEAYFILKNPDSKKIYDLEYQNYLNTETCKSKEPENDSSFVSNSFEYQSEEMKSWAKKAQDFGREMAKRSFDDAVGLTNSMVWGVVEKIPLILILLLVVVVLDYVYEK